MHAGAPGLQLTWMDAKMGDWVVTPRQGKPVEMQALWVAALEAAARLHAPHDPTFAHELDERAAVGAQLVRRHLLGRGARLALRRHRRRRARTRRCGPTSSTRSACARRSSIRRAPQQALEACERELLTPRRSAHAARATIATTAASPAISGSATAPTTRARCGRILARHLRRRVPARARPVHRRPARRVARAPRTATALGSSPRSSTAMRRTPRAAARRRRGGSPKVSGSLAASSPLTVL